VFSPLRGDFDLRTFRSILLANNLQYRGKMLWRALVIVEMIAQNAPAPSGVRRAGVKPKGNKKK
jgi:hypothetical protein